MGKLTKRERKFQSSGGVKSRLQKGTITKKGKMRHRKKHGDPSSAEEKNAQRLARGEGGDRGDGKRDRSDDFLGQENLGDLDVDSFFSKLTEKMAAEAEGGEDGGHQKEEEQESSDDEESDGAEDVRKKGGAAGKAKAQSSSSESDSSSGDSDSGDESDDDVERAEARMKAAMEGIESADPEFHKFLKENEEALLEFGAKKDNRKEEGSDDGSSAGSTDEKQPAGQEETKEKTDQRPTKEEGIHLTPKVLRSLARGTFKAHGVRSLKKLVAAYRSACHLADSSGDESKAKPGESGTVYVIDSSKVFDELMVLCLKRCHEAFAYHLLGDKKSEADEDSDSDENKPINPRILERSDKWPDLKPILLSFFRSTLHVMSEAKEPELQIFILKALSKNVRYLTPFPRIAESMLKSLVSLWSAPLDSSEDYQVVRLNAFLRIRQLALTQPFPFIEDCLKKTYLAYAKRAKFGSASAITTALPTLTFMGNCIVELYSLDYHSSYQHAFVYVRQLALLLRSAMQKKTPEAVQQVHCWQYVHSLKLWVAVLSSAAPTDDGAQLRSLVYPLTEVILGTARLAPSTRNLPLRFHCVRLLQQLAAAAEVFIPTTVLLLDCLGLKEWGQKPMKSRSGSGSGGGGGGGSATASRGIQTQMPYLLRLPGGAVDCLRTHEQLEAGMSELFVLLQREVELYRYSAGFPEYSSRIVQRLRKFSKETPNARWRTFGRGLVETCERYSAAAVEARSGLREAPKDVQRLECLRPPSEPSMRERHERSVQKETKALDATSAASAASSNKATTTKADGQEAAARGGTKKNKKKAGTEGGGGDGGGEQNKKRRKTSDPKNNKNNNNDHHEAEGAVAVVAPGRVMELEDEIAEGVDWSSEDEA